MIELNSSRSLYRDLSVVYYVFDWQGKQHCEQFFDKMNAFFEGKKVVGIALLGSHKPTPEEIGSFENIFFLESKPTNFAGKWKDKRLVAHLKNEHKKLVVYFPTEANKYVNKLLKQMNNALIVARKSEKLPNFDLAFDEADLSDEALLEKFEKYIIKG